MSVYLSKSVSQKRKKRREPKGTQVLEGLRWRAVFPQPWLPFKVTLSPDAPDQ